jgi:hypothetical protein
MMERNISKPLTTHLVGRWETSVKETPPQLILFRSKASPLCRSSVLVKSWIKIAKPYKWEFSECTDILRVELSQLLPQMGFHTTTEKRFSERTPVRPSEPTTETWELRLGPTFDSMDKEEPTSYKLLKKCGIRLLRAYEVERPQNAVKLGPEFIWTI